MLMLAIVLYIFARAMSCMWVTLQDQFLALLMWKAGLLDKISNRAIHCKSIWVVLSSMKTWFLIGRVHIIASTITLASGSFFVALEHQ